jgi:putative DNA primase/helicase
MVDQVTLEGRVLPIFPCRWETKKPTCDRGFYAATTDPTEIDRLWRDRPGRLKGVPTGEASGLAILDIDTRHDGEAWLAEFEATFGFPTTRIHATRSGGMHFVFRHRAGLRKSEGLIASGVDIRAEGSYAVWWPAAGYRVLCEGPVAPWPA